MSWGCRVIPILLFLENHATIHLGMEGVPANKQKGQHIRVMCWPCFCEEGVLIYDRANSGFPSYMSLPTVTTLRCWLPAGSRWPALRAGAGTTKNPLGSPAGWWWGKGMRLPFPSVPFSQDVNNCVPVFGWDYTGVKHIAGETILQFDYAGIGF